MLNKYLSYKWKHEWIKRLSEFPLKTCSRAYNSLRNSINDNLQMPPSCSIWSKNFMLFLFRIQSIWFIPYIHSLWHHSYRVFTSHLAYCKIFLCQSLPSPPKLYITFILPKHHILHIISLYLLLRAIWKKFKLNY